MKRTVKNKEYKEKIKKCKENIKINAPKLWKSIFQNSKKIKKGRQKKLLNS